MLGGLRWVDIIVMIEGHCGSGCAKISRGSFSFELRKSKPQSIRVPHLIIMNTDYLNISTCEFLTEPTRWQTYIFLVPRVNS